MRLGSLVCDLLISLFLFNGFLIFSGVWKVDHAVKYCIFIMRVLFCVFSISMNGKVPPPSPYTLQTIVLLLCTSSIFKDTSTFIFTRV
jgi:hypothetical protein